MRLNRRMCICIILVVGYVVYLFTLAILATRQTANWSAEATRRADANHDGGIDVNEAMAVYSYLGLSGDQIFDHFSTEYRLDQLLCKLIPGRKATVRKAENIHLINEEAHDATKEIVRSMIDRDHNGRINYKEATAMFRLLCGEEGYLPGDDAFDSLNLSIEVGSGGSFFYLFLYPPLANKGCEMEKVAEIPIKHYPLRRVRGYGAGGQR